MKKQSSKKPPALPKKRKKRKKLNPGDRVRAVLLAAVLIGVAVVSSLTAIYFHSAKTQDEAGLPQRDEVAVPLREETAAPVAETAAPAVMPPPVAAPPAPPVAVAPKPEAPPSGREVRPTTVRPGPAAVSPPAPPVTESRRLDKRALPAAAQGGVPERPSIPSRGTLVFVIDDAGHNLRDLEPFLAFPGPLTIAVLPGLPYSAETARRVRAAGKELFLHQPMESIGGRNPGPGAIRSGMGRDEIRAIISRNLDELWPVAV